MFQVQSKAQPLSFGPPVSSEILGSPEKGWASFPEWPAGGAVSEQISQSLLGKVFSTKTAEVPQKHLGFPATDPRKVNQTCFRTGFSLQIYFAFKNYKL